MRTTTSVHPLSAYARLLILAALIPGAVFAGPSSLALYDPQISATASAQTLYFPVTRSGDAGYDVIINYHTSNGSALAGVDYSSVTGPATLPAASPGIFLPVPIMAANSSGASRTFDLAVDSLTGVGYAPEFSAATIIQNGPGIYAKAPVLVDINADGKPDLVFATLNSSLAVRLNTTPPGAATPSFAQPQTFATGAGPWAIVVADVNGDGLPDVIVTNSSDNSVSVFVNTTTPGAAVANFAAQQTFATGAVPRSLAVADLNGDGRRDLIVANTNDDTLSVFVNTTPVGSSTASFASQPPIAVGSYLSSITTADINADGRDDVVVSDSSGGTIWVLLNSTAGGAATVTLSLPQQVACGASPQQVIATDLDSDGRPDLLVANYVIPGVISACRNETSPGALAVSFAAPAFSATGPFPIAMVTADLNNDGMPEIVSLDNVSGSTNASVLRNITPADSGVAQFEAPQSLTTGFQPESLDVADINGDGRRDLVICNSDGSLSIFMNLTKAGSASPTYTRAGTFAAAAYAYQVANADINADGAADAIVTDFVSGTVSILMNSRIAGTRMLPSYSAPIMFDAGNYPDSLSVVDIDGDGRPDIVVANVAETTVSILRNTTIAGSPTANFAARQVVDSGLAEVDKVAVFDVNGDGRKDLVIMGRSLAFNFAVAVVFNTTPAGGGTPTFAAPQVLPETGDVQAYDESFADINGDGLTDLVAIGNSTLEVRLNDTVPGSLTASFGLAQQFMINAFPGSIAIADINGDGRPDVVATQFGGMSVLINTTPAGAATAAFTDTELYYFNPNLPPSIVVQDLDGDGRPDLVVPNGDILLLVNKTPLGATVPSFDDPITVSVPEGVESISAVDVTGDGRRDIVAATKQNTVAVLVNTTYDATIARGVATGTIVHDNIFADGFE